MLKDAVPFGECKRALVVKLRHHGDVLLATPVLSVLKARGMEVDALAYDDTAPMLEGHPALSELHLVGRKWKGLGPRARLHEEKRLFQALRARRFDLIVHLSEHPRGAWLALTLGARFSVGPDVPGRGRFWRSAFTHRYPLNKTGRRHQVEINLDALRRIGIQPGMDERRVVFVPGEAAERRIDELTAPGPFVHVHPASRWRFKCWPAAQNAELIDRLAAEGYRLVVTSAPEETAFIDEILARAKARPLNLAGKLSIKELGALARRAMLFVGVDSMPMHLAAAMGTPTLALFGPSGELEWGPWNVLNRVITSEHPCRPCGQDGCGGGKVSECLTTLGVEPVHVAARELLASQ